MGLAKIPLLRSLLPSSDPDAWRAVPENGSTIYSALLGLVLQGVPSDANVEFPVESSYFDLDCYFMAYDLTSIEALQRMGKPLLVHHNASDLLGQTRQNYSNFFVDTSYSFTANRETLSQPNLFYGSRDFPTLQVALFNCTISTIPVESWIACQNALSAVTRMRQSQKDTRPPTSSPFSSPEYPGYNGLIAMFSFLHEFPQAAGEPNTYQSSPTDSYIHGDPTVFELDYQRNWSTINPLFFSTRLATALNTLWQTSFAPFTITSAAITDPVNLTAQPGMYPDFNATLGTTSRGLTVYRTSPS
jgi:hypothetical protein